MKSKLFNLLVTMSFFQPSCADHIPIVTVDSPSHHVLNEKTEPINEYEMPLAREIVNKLMLALKPYLPAAGLAAPQIGISKSVFIFRFDRDPNNLEGVINPSFVPVGETTVAGWEGCFSVMLSESCWKLAQVPRYETIQARYTNIAGDDVEKVLEGFAAKVFQHEYDHLQGIENINRTDAIVQEFASREEMQNFMSHVKNEDARTYKKPN